MGKWTLDYYDDVLNAKFKTLMYVIHLSLKSEHPQTSYVYHRSGAITRSGLEQDEPKISYERFVEELDTGDSFTTSVIDCLVKEVADRSSRPKAERNTVAQQTTRNLRQIVAAAQQVGSGRASRRHNRLFGLNDFLTFDPDNSSSGDEIAQFDSTAEGARVNSELFDVYNHAGTSNIPFPFLRRSSPDLLTNQRGDSSSHESAPVIPTSPSPRTITLSRQSSIRRPRRSRASADFNEYTSRRRSSYRDSLLRLEQGGSSSTSDTTPDLIQIPTRRFFPPSHRDEELESEDSRLSALFGFSPSFHAPSSRHLDTETSVGRAATRILRLGVFPPPTPESGSRSRSPPAETSGIIIRPNSPSVPTTDFENDVPLSATEEVAAYPTPRTIADETT
ncbi:hypothetical protein L218DRAFT_107140 [Marasmius fiardii PR-910]|nr:hypothetical protein L218DRAFT_107140 [Marasmius fiardii PR-910]